MTVEDQESVTGPVPAATFGWLRRLAVDITPLRTSKEFRRLWGGQTISLLGTQVTLVAVPVQIFALTNSSFDVGLMGLVALVPLVISGLLGATLVDAFDRRKIALCTSTGFMIASATLFAQQLAHLNQLWLLYLVVAVQSGLSGMDTPARRAFIPRLMPARDIPASNALSQISYGVAQTGGPLLAGLLLATSGLGACYLLDVLSFSGALYSLLRLRPMPPGDNAAPAGFGSLMAGLSFLRGQPIVLMTFLADINAMIFGMPRALFPALAIHRFHAGSGAVGLLYASVAAGALLGALGGGWFSRVRRQGMAVLLAIAAWGLAITAFGLTTWLWLALIFLAVAGGADMVSAVFRSTILQTSAPDDMQGRMQGVFIVVVAGGPRLGDLESGAVAAIGLEFSVVSGGIACLIGIAALAASVPSFRRFRTDAISP